MDYMRNGDDYRAGLRDGRAVYLNGERVEDVTTEPGFQAVVDTFAGAYDLQHDPAYRDRLTFVEGEHRYGAAWIKPRDQDVLAWRRGLIETVARTTAGLFGRQPDYVALIALGMLDMADEFAQGNPEYAENIRKWWEHIRTGDLALSHGFVDEQSDPAVPLEESDVLRMVGQRPEGIVVRGVKTVATFAPCADEVLIAAPPRPDAPDEYMLFFAIPIATPGLKVVARAHHAGAGSDTRPVDRFGDENDALLIFDDVLVPSDRIFSLGNAAYMGRVPGMLRWAPWAILVRLAVKVEVLTGLASLLPEMIGRTKRQESRDALGEVVRYLTTIRAFLQAAESTGALTEQGNFEPDANFIQAGRVYAVEHYRRIVSELHDLGTQGLIVMPEDADFNAPDIGPQLRHLFSGPSGPWEERTKLMRLAFDLSAGSFGGRQTLFELYNAQQWTLGRNMLLDSTDLGLCREMARYAAGISDAAPLPAQIQLTEPMTASAVGDKRH